MMHEKTAIKCAKKANWIGYRHAGESLFSIEKITLLVGILLAVAACSGIEEARRVEAMSDSGKCEAADAETHRIANQDFGGAAYLYAEIAMNCRKDRATAMSYLNLSARYGNETAQQQLAKMRLPIPAADLVAKKDTNCIILRGGLVHCE
jgi:hypothetical protein